MGIFHSTVWRTLCAWIQLNWILNINKASFLLTFSHKHKELSSLHQGVLGEVENICRADPVGFNKNQCIFNAMCQFKVNFISPLLNSFIRAILFQLLTVSWRTAWRNFIIVTPDNSFNIYRHLCKSLAWILFPLLQLGISKRSVLMACSLELLELF